MAYRPHIVLQWGGRLGLTSGEIWSNTLRVVGESEDVADLQSLADAWMETIVPEISTLVSGAGGYSSVAYLDYVKANAVDANGHQQNTATNVWFAPTDFPQVNGGSGAQAPYQLAIAVSFTTQAQRGLAARGRCFVPAGYQAGQFDGGNGIFSLTQATAIRDAWATFLTNLADNPGIDLANLRGAVMSKIGDPATNWHAINGVRVGRVYDTQRRRRNSVAEDYSPTAVVDYA